MKTEYKVICKKCLKELSRTEPVCSCGNVAIKYNELFFTLFVDDLKTITIKQVWYKKIKRKSIVIKERVLPPIQYGIFSFDYIFDFDFIKKKEKDWFVNEWINPSFIKEKVVRCKKTRNNKVSKLFKGE